MSALNFNPWQRVIHVATNLASEQSNPTFDLGKTFGAVSRGTVVHVPLK